MERGNGDSKTVFAGRVLTVRVDPVVAKSGPGTREVVVRPAATAVVAETDSGELVVIRQFRWAVGEPLFELPAGMIEPGEPALSAAQRELEEETGWRADEWTLVFDFFTSPGYSTERMVLYYARQLRPGTAHGDPDEEIAVHQWSRAKARRMLHEGQLRNGILLLGLSWWLSQLGEV